MLPHSQFRAFVSSVRTGRKKGVFFFLFFPLFQKEKKKKNLSQLVLNGLEEGWKSYISQYLHLQLS